MPRPLVLLSNDDGYDAPGILALRQELLACADVILVAPQTEQSATSHSLSLHKPLRARTHGEGVFSIDGTPADCVYIALHSGARFLPRRPDLVLSGINRGLNLGQDVFYSGTVAAAREGALRGIPSLATSAHPRADLPRFAALTARIALTMQGKVSCAGRAPLYNLNAPQNWTGEVRVCKTGARIYEEIVDWREDPRGREYLWLGGPGVRHDVDPGSDTEAYDDGAVSLTSLLLDLTQTGDEPELRALITALRDPGPGAI